MLLDSRSNFPAEAKKTGRLSLPGSSGDGLLGGREVRNGLRTLVCSLGSAQNEAGKEAVEELVTGSLEGLCFYCHPLRRWVCELSKGREPQAGWVGAWLSASLLYLPLPCLPELRLGRES